jgi:hypothetical protein
MDENLERAVTLFAVKTCAALREEDFLFTVTVAVPWDVYKFSTPRGDGTVALRLIPDPDRPGA